MRNPRKRGKLAATKKKTKQISIEDTLRKKAAEESGMKWGDARRRRLEQKIDGVIEGFLKLSAEERKTTIEQLKDGTLLARIDAGGLTKEQEKTIRDIHTFAQMIESGKTRKRKIDGY